MRISDGSSDVCSSDLTVIRDEPGGRDKNKRWIAEDADAPRDQHWLWKYRQTTGDGSEAALTDCAEVFTSRLPAPIDLPARSEERRVGKACVNQCRSRGTPNHLKNKKLKKEPTN